MALYDQIGRLYDTTRRADPYLTSRLLALLAPNPGGLYLDLACGTGNYTSALTARSVRFVGADVSPVMLRSAHQKSPHIPWVQSDATCLPFAKGIMDGAICTLAIHHFRSQADPFAEVARVLKPNSRFVIFTTTPEQTGRYWLREYFPTVMRRAVQMPTLQVVSDALNGAGCPIVATEPYEVREDLQDLFLYSGKHRPELYLDPRVRAGISSFANLANTEEVERGCRRLAGDITSGRIQNIVQKYKHALGDYLFVVARRR